MRYSYSCSYSLIFVSNCTCPSLFCKFSISVVGNFYGWSLEMGPIVTPGKSYGRAIRRNWRVWFWITQLEFRSLDPNSCLLLVHLFIMWQLGYPWKEWFDQTCKRVKHSFSLGGRIVPLFPCIYLGYDGRLSPSHVPNL